MPELNKRGSIRTQTYQDSPHYVHLILVLLCICYFGKYYCTSDMYVVQENFKDDQGITPQQMSMLYALGYFFSMFGKVAAGIMSDNYGGRFVVFLSCGGYVICAVVFSLIPSSVGYYGFLVPWAGLGFFALGLAWVAIVAVATNWVPVSHLGRLMSLVSMAPQLGDAMARISLAWFLHYGWRTVFQIAAGTAFVFTLPIIFFVGNAPTGADDTIQDAKKEADKSKKEQKSMCQKLMPLFKNPLLWILCLLSGSLYGTRTLFLLYSTSFLAQVYCLGENDDCLTDGATLKATATASSVYTLLGCVSVLLVGVLKDKLPKKHRALTLFFGCCPLFLAMGFLMLKGTNMSFGVAVTIVALTGFCLFGPYKVLGAVFAVDIGGKELKSTACSFMGVFDNLFAMCMLFVKGWVGDDWTKMFAILSGLSFMSLCCASYVWIGDLKKAAPAPEQTEKLLDANDPKAVALLRRQSFHENKECQ
jgi:sugar phosphate permease